MGTVLVYVKFGSQSHSYPISTDEPFEVRISSSALPAGSRPAFKTSYTKVMGNKRWMPDQDRFLADLIKAKGLTPAALSEASVHLHRSAKAITTRVGILKLRKG